MEVRIDAACMRCRHIGSSAGAHLAYDVASPTTESRAPARSAPSAVKASVKPEAWCESTRRFAPKTAGKVHTHTHDERRAAHARLE